MTNTASTRRSFIQTAGAALSAPLAVAAAAVPASAAHVTDDPNARLAYLEDAEAIRRLNLDFANRVNTGVAEVLGELYVDRRCAKIDPEIRNVVPYAFGVLSDIEFAPDRESATAWLPCTVHLATELGPSCPLVEMAKAQGCGVVHRTERGVFENEYVRRDGSWKIQRTTYRPSRPSWRS
jgi:hypothetical protein